MRSPRYFCLSLMAWFSLAEVVGGLAVGSDHACVVLDDGSVKCFGQNKYGQLGQGDTTARGKHASNMGDDLEAVDLGGSGATSAVVVAMSAGSDHTCVILLDGRMKCFGRNNRGQLGLGDDEHRGDDTSEMGDLLPPVFLGVNRTAVAVVAEGDRTCALLDSGNVRCWGDAEFGALGGGDETDTGDGDAEVADTVDLGVEGDSAVVAIGEGPCAVFDDGSVKCWGKGYYGKNGQGVADNAGDDAGEMGDALGAVPLGTGKRANAVVGGRDFNCAILEGGSLKCWGRGEGGQLGTEHILTIGDDPDEMADALPLVDLGSDETVVEVTAGLQHTCAILFSGAVKCWGRNFFGNLGLGSFRGRGFAPGSMGDSLPEVDLGTGRTALSIAAGSEYTCAVLDDGSLKCWGSNEGGQLGLGDTTPRGLGPSQMGDDLPSVALGSNRTAVALARSTGTIVPTESPTGAPTTSPTSMPTPAPTAGPTTAGPTPAPTPGPSPIPTNSPLNPTSAPLNPESAPLDPTPAPSATTPAPSTSNPSLLIEATEREANSSFDGVSTTMVASIAVPLAILFLLGCIFCARRSRGAASIGAKAEGSTHGSLYGDENTVEDSAQAAVV